LKRQPGMPRDGPGLVYIGNMLIFIYIMENLKIEALSIAKWHN